MKKGFNVLHLFMNHTQTHHLKGSKFKHKSKNVYLNDAPRSVACLD